MTKPAEMGYEAARDALVATVKRLESGGLTLEESLTVWQEGERLAAVCRSLLAGAQQQVEQLEVRESGPSTDAADAASTVHPAGDGDEGGSSAD